MDIAGVFKRYKPLLKGILVEYKNIDFIRSNLNIELFFKSYEFNNGWYSVTEKSGGNGKYELRFVINHNGDRNEVSFTKEEEKYNNKVIASWELVQMKNCCGVCVSTNACVTPDFRKIGIGSLLNQMRVEMAKSDGYGVLFCTAITGSERKEERSQRHILERNGWSLVHKFTNPRTKNKVGMYVVNLK
jgi:hypothetical protein